MGDADVPLPLAALRSGVKLVAGGGPLSPNLVTVFAVRLEYHAHIDPGGIVIRVYVLERGAQVVKGLRGSHRNPAAFGQAVANGCPRLTGY